MENDLRLLVLSVVASHLIRRAGVTPQELKADLAAYLAALRPGEDALSQDVIDFCAETIDALCAGAPATRPDD